MKCNYDNNNIIAYIDGQLSDSERKEFKEHLKSCDRCSKKYRVLTYTEGYFRQDIEMKQSLSDNVMADIDKNRYSKGTVLNKAAITFYRHKPIWKAALSVTAAILLFVFIFRYNSYIIGIKDNIVAGFKQLEQSNNDNANNNSDTQKQSKDDEIVPLETPMQSSIPVVITTPVPSHTKGSDEGDKTFDAFSDIKGFSPMEACIIKTDFAVELINLDQYRYQYLVSGSYDLDCDGEEDQISCVLNYRDESTLKVNDVSISFQSENPYGNYVIILDFDINDNYKEVLIYDDGPSGDSQHYCFRYNGKEILSLGSIINPLLDGHGKMLTGLMSFVTPNVLTGWAEIKDNEIKNYDIDISSAKNKSYVISYDFEAYFVECDDQNGFQMPLDLEYLQNFKKGDTLIIKDMKEDEYFTVPIWYFVELQNGKTGILYFWMGD